MNEQTKIELLKIAATLTTSRFASSEKGGQSGKSAKVVIKDFEFFASYLFENFDKLGSPKN